MSNPARRRVSIWLVLMGLLCLAGLFHQQIIGHVAYAVEKGRLSAGHEHLAKVEAISEAFRLVASQAGPAVVRIQTRVADERELKDESDEESLEDMPELLERFKKLYHSKNGLAVVPVQEGACSGCQISLSPQTVSAAGMGDRIVSCDHCGRILYVDDGTLDL